MSRDNGYISLRLTSRRTTWCRPMKESSDLHLQIDIFHTSHWTVWKTFLLWAAPFSTLPFSWLCHPVTHTSPGMCSTKDKCGHLDEWVAFSLLRTCNITGRLTINLFPSSRGRNTGEHKLMTLDKSCALQCVAYGPELPATALSTTRIPPQLAELNPSWIEGLNGRIESLDLKNMISSDLYLEANIKLIWSAIRRKKTCKSMEITEWCYMSKCLVKQSGQSVMKISNTTKEWVTLSWPETFTVFVVSGRKYVIY